MAVAIPTQLFEAQSEEMAEDIPAEYTESYRSSLNFQDDTPLMPVQHIRPAPQYPNTTAKEDEENRR